MCWAQNLSAQQSCRQQHSLPALCSPFPPLATVQTGFLNMWGVCAQCHWEETEGKRGDRNWVSQGSCEHSPAITLRFCLWLFRV